MEIQTSSKKAKKKFISISGLDGSGKSTFIDLLERDMEGVNIIHMVNFRLINKLYALLREVKSSTIKSQEEPKNIDKSRKSNLISYLNLALLFIDLIYFKIYYLCQSKTLIMDRYFYDLYVSHYFRYGSSKFLSFLILITPKPSSAIYLDVDAVVAQKRESDDFHDIEYFTKKRDIYFSLLPSKTFFVIKNETITATYSKIKMYLSIK